MLPIFVVPLLLPVPKSQITVSMFPLHDPP